MCFAGTFFKTQYLTCFILASCFTTLPYVLPQKRKRSDEDNDRDIPADVYVEGVDGSASEYEMKSVRSNTSRAQTVKSALSRGGASIKSKFSRNRSGNLARNQEPLAPMHEGGFEDETINTNDQEGVMM